MYCIKYCINVFAKKNFSNLKNIGSGNRYVKEFFVVRIFDVKKTGCVYKLRPEEKLFLLTFEALFALIWLVNFERYRMNVKHVRFFMFTVRYDVYDKKRVKNRIIIIYKFLPRIVSSVLIRLLSKRVLPSLRKNIQRKPMAISSEMLSSPLWPVEDSNPWPAGYESSTLTTRPQLYNPSCELSLTEQKSNTHHVLKR